MSQALIGYTGFVGSHLHRQVSFTQVYNSKNIAEIQGREFDIVYCAGAPGRKWWANQHPEEDAASIDELIFNLKKVETKLFVLISSVDVYPSPLRVNEETQIDLKSLHPYGKNRYRLEEFVAQNFPHYLIVRLPGLFGQGLKKNIVFDFLHNNQLENIHAQSSFQFYNLERLSQDIATALENKLFLVNFATEPVTVAEVAEACFKQNFQNTKAGQAAYDVHTKYGAAFGGKGNYIMSKKQVLAELCTFVEHEQKSVL
jgi:nucleoside-diphosphate-sugar epimerase